MKANENNLYIAIDIGASSGRHMLGRYQNGKITYNEIYRFSNGFTEIDGHKCWDIKSLVNNVIEGMKRCGETIAAPGSGYENCEIVSVGVDTWGVDFVLLDEENRILGNAVAYRDDRTKGMDERVYRYISEEELYSRTGIQKQVFNTIYQLMYVKLYRPEDMGYAKAFLMMPDYINYVLTGNMYNEYTEATTTQLVNAQTEDWDYSLIKRLGFNEKMFRKIVSAGTEIGELTSEIQRKVGFSCKVVAPCTHDTGSAVAALPYSEGKSMYISSGTWSLMGIEKETADCGSISRIHNFTNEGGIEKRFRYLKNIMGLWMIQSIRNEEKKNSNASYSFADLCNMAEKEDIDSIVDCNDLSFLAPDSMEKAVQDFCRRTGQRIPWTTGEIACVVYNSLANFYGRTAEEIEKITGDTYDSIVIIGGGSRAEYLNKLTEKYSGKKVITGSPEATALGNIMVQMISDGLFDNILEARKHI